MQAHPEAPGSWMNYFTDNGKTYNMHHFWSNFEIGDVRFFAGKGYQSYFEFLDQEGGFYYERWGDAPVHSLGVGLWANHKQVP
jgi:alpha 1,2-mannosyltransferase